MKSLLTLFLLGQLSAFAQFTDSFSDGDLTSDPSWFNSSGSFEVDESFRLHLNATPESGEAFLSTPCTVSLEATWRFRVKMDFNPSSANYCRIYLMCSSATNPDSVNGFFVMVGGSSDEISLYSQKGKTLNKLIDGPDKWLDKTSVEFSVAVFLDGSGNWSLNADTNLSGTFAQLGTINYPAGQGMGFFGVYTRFSSTRANKFWFDDFEVSGNSENIPPTLLSAKAIGLDRVRLELSETLDPISVAGLNNYLLDGAPANSVMTDGSGISLIFPPQINPSSTRLHIHGLKDLNNNLMPDTAITLDFCEPLPTLPGDIVFSELMVDPTPVASLPPFEYIELYNRSEKVVSLDSCRINTKLILTQTCLAPGSFSLLVDQKAENSFSFPVLSCSLGSYFLNNESLKLELTNKTGQRVSGIHYDSHWFDHRSSKYEGGHSIELSHLNSLCPEFNGLWMFSEDQEGGTPGRDNSIEIAPVSDSLYPKFYFLKGGGFRVEFNEPLIAFKRASLGGQPVTVFLGDPLPNFLSVAGVDQGQTIFVDSLQGCFSNKLRSFNIPIPPTTSSIQDLVINELLYHPLNGCSDFLELLNSGDSWINLDGLRVHNKPTTEPNQTVLVDSLGLLLGPGEYLLLTDQQNLYNFYPQTATHRIWEMKLPNFTNGQGSVWIYDSLLNAIEELAYSDQLHHKQLSTTEGVSLERIDPKANNTNDNWTSASSLAGFASPGFKNSARKSDVHEGLILSTELITPNMDGHNDKLTMSLGSSFQGSLSVDVFTSEGMPVKSICKQQPVSSVEISWLADNKHGELVPSGIYVIYLELFDGEVMRERLKRVVTVSR